MAKVSKAKRLKSGHQSCKKSPCQMKVCSGKLIKHVSKEKQSIDSEDWKAAACSVCLEFPHNAVLLLCSSYDKGCRPYMCATSYRFSNCLDQYRKAYTKITSVDSMKPWGASEDLVDSNLDGCEQKSEVSELLCPLCRGQVKGWTVVEPARMFLNKKKRLCLQDNCSFVGNYKQLRKHVKVVHPSSRPREVDPVKEKKWKLLEGERAQRDAISTVMSSTPGGIIVGDYVIETDFANFFSGSDSDGYSDDGLLSSGRLVGARNGWPLLRGPFRRGFRYREDGRGLRRRLALPLVGDRDAFPVVSLGTGLARVLRGRRHGW